MNLDRVIAVRTSKTIYRDGAFCIKVFNREYSKADVLNEALNQARVEQTGLNIPKVVEVTTVDGKWAIVSEFVEGKTLAKLMAEEPEKRDEYLDLFVGIQLDILSKTDPNLTKLKDKMNRKISQADLDATTRYDLHTRLEGMPKHNKLCHGDFDPSNIIITPEGKPYIIDWAHATQGTPAADVAMTYMEFSFSDAELADAYLDAYCEKADMPKQLVFQWLPIVAAAELARGHKDNEEALLSWIDVADWQ